MHLIRCPVLRAMAACLVGVITLGTLFGCGGARGPDAPTTMPPALASDEAENAYVIGPTDQLNIFVWRQPELSTNAIVRPDGRISVPLIDDLQAFSEKLKPGSKARENWEEHFDAKWSEKETLSASAHSRKTKW